MQIVFKVESDSGEAIFDQVSRYSSQTPEEVAMVGCAAAEYGAKVSGTKGSGGEGSVKVSVSWGPEVSGSASAEGLSDAQADKLAREGLKVFGKLLDAPGKKFGKAPKKG